MIKKGFSTYSVTPKKGENVRATSEYVYLGAFTSAQASLWMIA